MNATANPTETLYDSDNYLVLSNDYGVEVTDRNTMTSEWLRHGKADDLRRVLKLAEDTGMSADHYLSNYFFV